MKCLIKDMYEKDSYGIPLIIAETNSLKEAKLWIEENRRGWKDSCYVVYGRNFKKLAKFSLHFRDSKGNMRWLYD